MDWKQKYEDEKQASFEYWLLVDRLVDVLLQHKIDFSEVNPVMFAKCQNCDKVEKRYLHNTIGGTGIECNGCGLRYWAEETDFAPVEMEID